MNLEKIKYFIDLVECKNFTETAKKNFVSQTTISQQIASLEKEFNKHMKAKMATFQQQNSQTFTIEYSAITDMQS